MKISVNRTNNATISQKFSYHEICDKLGLYYPISYPNIRILVVNNN